MKIFTKNDLETLAKKYKSTEKEALILLADVLNSSYSSLFFKKEIELSNIQLIKFLEFLKRKNKYEPISKIIEKKEFYGLNFKTNKYTLDPRPETELIIDLFQKYFIDINQKISILDLGSGTGCISLSILNIYKNANAELVDISKEALNISIENSKYLNVYNRCKFTLSNWFENINSKYDVIVSNPPYICNNYELEKEVLYDPKIALFAGKSGLDAYKNIIPNSSNYLKENGKLFVEIGFDQKNEVIKLNKNLKLLEILKDYSNIDRILAFSK